MNPTLSEPNRAIRVDTTSACVALYSVNNRIERSLYWLSTIWPMRAILLSVSMSSAALSNDSR